MKRRDFFLYTAGLGAIAAGVRGAVPTSVNFKAAIIGHTGRGNYGHGVDVIFADRPNIEVVAVSDPHAEGRAKAQTRTKAKRSYADFREMLERERPNLVAVGPRWTDQHHAMIGAALAIGAHVYTEKPFTRSLAEADELLAMAARTGRKIAVAFPSRLGPGTLDLKRRIDDGMIGELVEVRMQGKQDKRAGGEDLLVLGSHICDLARFFAGDAEWCSARVLQKGRDVVPQDARPATEDIGLIIGDQIEAMFGLPRGVNIFFASSQKKAVATGPFGMEFVGSKGVARLVAGTMPRTFLRKGDQWEPIKLQPEPTPQDSDQAAGNRRVVDDWLAAIAEDREPLCSGRAGMKSLEMIHAIFAAGLSRNRVAMPLQNRQHPLG